jgi:NADH dehydrogenase
MLVHSGPVILPELGKSLGRYTHEVLARRGVELRLNTRVKSMTEDTVSLADNVPIPCRTLVWTAGTVPSPLISSLPCAKERGRIVVNQFLQVPSWPNVWAVGDCAFMPDIRNPGRSHPPTAQHAIREGKVCCAEYRGCILKSSSKIIFVQDHRATGLNRSSDGRGANPWFQFFSFFAWWMWRTIYLSKLPGLDKKVRVAFDWTLDLLFPKDVCAVHDLPYRRDFHRPGQATHTVGNNGDYQPNARQLVHSSMGNSPRGWEANEVEGQTQRVE